MASSSRPRAMARAALSTLQRRRRVRPVGLSALL